MGVLNSPFQVALHLPSLGRCTSAGLPVVFVHVGLWDPSAYDVDEHERYLLRV